MLFVIHTLILTSKRDAQGTRRAHHTRVHTHTTRTQHARAHTRAHTHIARYTTYTILYYTNYTSCTTILCSTSLGYFTSLSLLTLY